MNVRACKQNHLCNYIHYRVFSPLEYACMHSFRSIMNGWCGCWKLLDASVLWIKYSIWLRAFVMFSHNTKRISMYYNSVIEKKSHLRSLIFVAVFSSRLNFATGSNFRQRRHIGELMFMYISLNRFAFGLLVSGVQADWYEMQMQAIKDFSAYSQAHKILTRQMHAQRKCFRTKLSHFYLIPISCDRMHVVRGREWIRRWRCKCVWVA